MGNIAAPSSKDYKNHPRWKPHDLPTSTGDSDCPCNFLFIGPTRTGKTTLLYSFFNECLTCEPTIGYETMVQVVVVDEYDVKFQVWDTSGEFDYRELSKKELASFDAVFLFADPARFPDGMTEWPFLEEFQPRLFSATVLFYAVAISLSSPDASEPLPDSIEAMPDSLNQFIEANRAAVLRSKVDVEAKFLEIARLKIKTILARDLQSPEQGPGNEAITKSVKEVEPVTVLLDSMKNSGEIKMETADLEAVSQILADVDHNQAPYPKPENVDDSKFREKFNEVNNAEEACIVS